MNYAIIAEDLNDKRNEVSDLKEKVEALEDIVMEVVNRIESITTPTKKGTKKRRRIKQTPSPLQTVKTDRCDVEPKHPVEELHSQETGHGESENEITAEEINKMYESG